MLFSIFPTQPSPLLKILDTPLLNLVPRVTARMSNAALALDTHTPLHPHPHTHNCNLLAYWYALIACNKKNSKKKLRNKLEKPTHRCQPANHHDSKFSVLLIVVRALRTATARRGEGMTKGPVGQATCLLRPLPTAAPAAATPSGTAEISQPEPWRFNELPRFVAQPDAVFETPPNHRQLPTMSATDAGTGGAFW